MPHRGTSLQYKKEQDKTQCLLNYDKKIEFHVHSGFCKLGFSF